MKIIDAFWEKENTGLKVCEVVFDTNDRYDAFPSAEIETSYDFCVAKAPVGSSGLVYLLENECHLRSKTKINHESPNSRWRTRFPPL